MTSLHPQIQFQLSKTPIENRDLFILNQSSSWVSFKIKIIVKPTNILTIKKFYFTFKYLCILTQKPPLPHMVPSFTEMWVGSGSWRLCGGLLGLTEASSTAKCSWLHQFLRRLLSHSSDAVLGLWWPFISGQHYRNRGHHSNSQVWTSGTLCGQFDGLGWTQGGEKSFLFLLSFDVILNTFSSYWPYDLNILFQVQVSARGEVTVTLPPKLELRCPPLAVANNSLEFTLVSWGAVGVDVDWKITKEKDGVQVAKGKIQQHTSSEQLMTLSWSTVN